MKEKGGAAAAMNGLEKITGQILAQAREEAKKIEHQSAEEAEKIRACAEKEAEAWEEKAVSSLERELEEPMEPLKKPQVWKELLELFQQRLAELRQEDSNGDEKSNG